MLFSPVRRTRRGRISENLKDVVTRNGVFKVAWFQQSIPTTVIRELSRPNFYICDQTGDIIFFFLSSIYTISEFSFVFIKILSVQFDLRIRGMRKPDSKQPYRR